MTLLLQYTLIFASVLILVALGGCKGRFYSQFLSDLDE